jgi:hypothetical protein
MSYTMYTIYIFILFKEPLAINSMEYPEKTSDLSITLTTMIQYRKGHAVINHRDSGHV